MAVDERCHSPVMHMPIVISVRNLRDIVIEHLLKKHSTTTAIAQVDSTSVLAIKSVCQPGFEIYRTLSSQVCCTSPPVM